MGVWDFIQDQVLGMKWLNEVIGFGLSKFKIFSADDFKHLATFNSNIPFAFFLFRALAPRKIREISLE